MNTPEQPADNQAEPEADRQMSRTGRKIAAMATAAVLLPGVSTHNVASDSVYDEQVVIDTYHPGMHSNVVALRPPDITIESKTASKNVVLILADDLDWNLMPYMPYTNSLVGDAGTKVAMEDEQSLCCTARSTLLTGKYSHNTRVVGNSYPQGGYVAFHTYDEANALPVWLDTQGFYTSFMGKYMNQFPAPDSHPGVGVADDFVPPGWDSFVTPVEGSPYTQLDQKLNVNGQVDQESRHRYFGDTLASMALKDLDSMPDNQPFFQEISTYSPHSPYTYPKRLDGTFTDVRVPRTPDYNERDISDKVTPLRNRQRLGKEHKDRIDEVFRSRVRAVQVIDGMVKDVIDTLETKGELDDTYVIFTSDNGFYTGSHRRHLGKYDQFQSTLSVPFYVRGPGISPGTDLRQTLLAGNVDIAPTIADMANVSLGSSVDGLSLLPALTGGSPGLGRDYLLIGRGSIPTYSRDANGLEEPSDGRAPSRKGGVLSDFFGVYSGRYKYVAFSDGYDTEQRREEFYDERTDPYELDNLLGPYGEGESQLSRRKQLILDDMRRALPRLLACAGSNCSFESAKSSPK